MAQYGAGEASKNIWGFDPTSIGGCVLWLDGADRNTVFSDTGGTTLATNGSVVGRWNDKSISLNHATRITSSTTYPISGATYSIDSASGRNFLNFGYANVSLTGHSGGFFNVISDKTLSVGQAFYPYSTFLGGTYTLSITANTTYYIVGVGGTLPNLTLSLSGTVGGLPITPSGTLTNPVPAMIDGGAFTLVAGTRLPTGQANGTYFFVGSLGSGSLAPSTGHQIFNYGNWGSAEARQFIISANNYAISTVNTSNTNNSVVGSFTNKVYTSVLDSYKLKSWINGSEGSGGVTDLTTQTPAVNTGTLGLPYIGCFMGAGPFTNASYGTTSEILVYNSTLSNTDRQIVEGYLAWKWQLQSALPLTHPYNNNAITPQFTPNDFGAMLWLDAADTSSIIPTPTNGSIISIWRDKGSSVASFVPVASSPIFDTSTGYNAVLITNTISGTSYVMTSAATGTGSFTGNITIAGTVYTATITAGSTTLTTSTATIIEQLSVVTAGTYGTVIIGADVRLNSLSPAGTVSVQQTLRSSASIQYMNTSSTVSSPFSAFAVVKYANRSINTVIADFSNNTNFSMRSFDQYNVPIGNTAALASGAFFGRTSDARVLLEVTYDPSLASGSRVTLYTNGNSRATGGTATATTYTNQLLLNNTTPDVNGSSGLYYHELIILPSGTTSSRRQQIEGYLTWKWGLQASLPATHPYALANYFFNNTRPFSRSFSPTDLPNCIMWYDAADLRTMFTNTAGTTQVTGTGSLVRFWRDKSGSGNNLTSDSDNRSPTLTTSSNPQRFDLVFDGGDYLSNTALVNNSNTYTKFLVFRRTNNPSTPSDNYQRLFSYGKTTGDQQNDDPSGFHLQTANTQTNYNIYKSFAGSGNLTISSDTYHIISIVAGPTTISTFLNGSLTATNTFTPLNTDFSATTFRLGTNFVVLANAAWPGFINEVISYNRQLQPYEFRKVEGYLAWKWGIRSSLPTTHPLYKYPTPSLTPFQPELQLYNQTFTPSDLNPIIWIDPQDNSTLKLDESTNRLLTIESKSDCTRSITDVPITLVSVTSTTFTLSLTSGLVIASPITPSANVAGTPGLTANTIYYVASISGNNVTLASSIVNARSGTAISGFTTNASLNVTAVATISISPTFTILSVSSNIFTISSQNGLTVGTRIIPDDAVGGTPGLSAGTSYYISLISGNTIRLATSLANALDSTHMTGFTNNASVDASVRYVFCLSKPSSISGPLLATSSVNNGPSLKYMEFANGGIFKLSSAVISGTTLTLTTEIPHNIPEGRQINLNILSATYGEFGPNAISTAMGPFHVRYASLDSAGTQLTLVTSTFESGIFPGSNVYLNVNTATYNGGNGSSATDLSANYTVPANISVTATSSTTGTNVITLSSVTGLAIGQGIQFTTSFGGIPINFTHYINTISGNNITISTSPFGTTRTLTTSATGSTGTAGTFSAAIILTLPTAKTAGVIRVGDITIRNNAGLSGPYIVATTPTSNTLTVTTYSTLTASTLRKLVGRIEYGLLSFSSANLTSTTSMTIHTPIPHGLPNSATFSSSFVSGILPSGYITFTGATVNATGTLLTINTGISNSTLINTSGLACGLFLPSGTTFANGVQAGQSTTATTQTGTDGTTQIIINISTASANQGALVFVTTEPGKLILNPTVLIGSLGSLNSGLYTVSSSTTNSITFTVPSQTRSGIVTYWSQLGIINGYDGVISNNSSHNSYLNFPVNGYALENTSLGGALISREVTMIYVSHLLQGPLRANATGSATQSSIISTSVSVNGDGGANTTLNGQDYRIQASFNAGTSRFQLKHNNLGVNQNPTYTNNIASSSTVPSPFRVHSMVINTRNTNIEDIAAFTKCIAVNGWRYSNVTTSSLTQTATVTTSATVSTVTGIPSTAGFRTGSTVVRNAVLGGTGAFGTNSTITAINNNGTEITVTGTTAHTAGTIYFSVTPANSVSNTANAAAVGNIATTSYLRPTHLRIGGDTSATTTYATHPLCGSWYEGGIGDIIIFNSILSVEQRQFVEGFLAQKYHTASTLGGTSLVFNTSFVHPYRLNEDTISPSLNLTQTYAQGLAAWFDAANSSTIGFHSGNLVNSWSSAGGNVSGLTLTQSINSVNCPVLEQSVQNGLPGIKFIRGAVNSDTGKFPGSSNLTTPSSRNMNQFTTISSNSEYTNFMVIKFTVSPEDGHTAMVIVSGNDRPYLLKGNLVQYRKSFSQEVVYSPVLLINTPYIITTIRRGSTGTVIAVGNGARNITTTSFGENVQITGAFTRVTMGGYGPDPADNNDSFEGYIHEFVGFRYALTDQAIFQIEGYLAWKWGLQGAPPVGSSPAVVSLPETHPYYKLRP